MINALTTIWALIGIITGGAILLTMAVFAIGFIVATIKGLRKK